MAPFLIVLDDLLPPEICTTMIQEFTGPDEEYVHIDNGMALYKRGRRFNKRWAEVLFERIRELIPAQYRAVGCNECFRFSEYEPGGEFKLHRDGFNQDSHGNRSVITVNIFLNDDFEGGATDFFWEDRTLRKSVEPKPGRAAIFDSRNLHAGQLVTAGKKYLLRTDVMSAL